MKKLNPNYISTDKDGGFEKIAVEELENYIGDLVHVSWAYKGAVWRLKGIQEHIAILETRTTKKILRVNIKDLRKTK